MAQDPSFALKDNLVQRTPCMLVLDASGSMTEKISSGARRIDELNRGLKTLQTELHADSYASVRVQVAIVTVGGPVNDADVMLDWTDAKDFQAFDLTANNETPLGKGLLLALERIEQQKAAYRQHGINYTRPWIMVITDGAPTDSDAVWQQAVQACRRDIDAKKVVVWPIGVEGTNVAKLQEISTNPVKLLNQTKFVELFVWLSTSLRAASRKKSGDDLQVGSTSDWDTVKI